MRFRTPASITVVALVAAAGLSACSSSSGDSTSSGSGGGSSDNPAAAVLQKLETQPTELTNLPEKISKPIPSGKQIYVINCGTDACAAASKLLAEATQGFGWTVKDIKTDSSSQSLGAAWGQVIADKPAFAVDQGVPLAQVKTYVEQATANGTVVMGQGIDEPERGELLKFVVGTGEASAPEGDAAAAWVADDAQTNNVSKKDALYVDLPDFSVLAPIGEAFKSGLAKYCSSCKAETLDVGLTSIGNAADLVISYLRAHPSIGYVAFSALGPFAGVPPALKGAGLDVKITGTAPSDTSLTQLRAGAISSVVAYPYYEAAYAMADTMARYAAGVEDSEPAPTYTVPLWVLTKENVPSDNVFEIVKGSREKYQALWTPSS